LVALAAVHRQRRLWPSPRSQYAIVDVASYAIVGTGAVGGYYGAQLARAGCEVSFLVRSDLEHVRRHGLRVLSPDGDIALHESVLRDPGSVLTLADLTLGLNSDPWMLRAPVKALLRSGCKVTRHPPRGSV